MRPTLAAVSLMFGLLVFARPNAVAGDSESTGKPFDYTVHSGYFEKNNSGLKGTSSFLLISDAKTFDQVFGTAFVVGKKPSVLPENAFESKSVLAVIKRGGEVWSYEVESVKAHDSALTVRYKATAKDGGGATFASPLIISLPKGSYRSVTFVENGKEAGKVRRETE